MCALERGKRSSLVASAKSVASRLDRPALLTLYRLFGSLSCGLLLHPSVAGLPDRVRCTLFAAPGLALPAVFLFVANHSNSIALDRVGISLTYTSKCAIPLATVLLTLALDGPGALPNGYALASLAPVAAGVAAASWNAPALETVGIVAALVSCAAQACLNVFGKRAMTTVRPPLSGLEAQRAMVTVAALVAVAAQTPRLLQRRSHHDDGGDGDEYDDGKSLLPHPPLRPSLAAVAAYHSEYVLSFCFVRLVAPVTYGICDAVRRLSIIVIGRKMFGGAPFSTLNKAGMACAIVGALSYSLATAAN